MPDENDKSIERFAHTSVFILVVAAVLAALCGLGVWKAWELLCWLLT